VVTFYVYSAQREDDFLFENVVAANLMGVLLFLHYHALDPSCPRHRDITRIRRYRVSALGNPADITLPEGGGGGGRFAPLVMFSNGRAADASQQAITSVGCAVPGEDGWPPEGHRYSGATFFSFPGPCRELASSEKDAACRAQNPGGQCYASVPDGSAQCTWTAEPLGEVRISELSGVLDEKAERERCLANPAWEWTLAGRSPDHGDAGACFWDGRGDPTRNAERAEALDRLFAMRYPDVPPDIPPPLCHDEH